LENGLKMSIYNVINSTGGQEKTANRNNAYALMRDRDRNSKERTPLENGKEGDRNV